MFSAFSQIICGKFSGKIVLYPPVNTGKANFVFFFVFGATAPPAFG